MKWLKYEESDCIAIAIYKYQSDNVHHMELKVGDFLYIKDNYPGWYRGFKYTNPCVLKVFPSTHIKILSNDIYPDLWAEIYSWIFNIRKAYLEVDIKEFDQISDALQLVLGEKLKTSESNKRTINQKMEITRKLLGLPYESRNEKGEKVDIRTVSVLDLYEQHQRDQDNIRNISNSYDNVCENVSIYLKMLRINFERPQFQDETIDINISLYKYEEKNRMSRISETYSHRVLMRMNECDLIRANAIVTKDIQFLQNQRVFLVFHFIRSGPMCVGKKTKKDEQSYRRPKGVAVFEITNTIDERQEHEPQIGIYLIQKEECLEVLTEQLIHDFRVNRREFRSFITIQLKVISPDDYNDRNVVLMGMNPYNPSPIRTKRNCLYLTLHHAEIDREKKKSDPNLEVEISIRDHNGKEIELPSVEWRRFQKYKSVVYYHVGKPKWCEVICIPLFDKPETFIRYAHIQFVIWHRSLNDNIKSPRGVAYLNLFSNESKAMLPNKEHENFHKLAIHKMDIERIQAAEYLKIHQDFDSSSECSFPRYSNIFPSKQTMSSKKKQSNLKDTLFVQTLLCSTEYTFDSLLASICCNDTINKDILCMLESEEIKVKIIDVNELKKFAVKLLESSLNLMQRVTIDTKLGRNLLLLLGEMFKAIRNLPEYLVPINAFINETSHFNVHKQMLHELIEHVPETDSNILRESEWFMKIIVKSFKNYEEIMGSNDEANIFNELVDRYLQKLELWANRIENKLLRSIVLKGAGPIINTLIPVCQPIGMAKLVHNLLKSCKDIDSLTKAGLTMDCMNSKLFIDPQCRKIILPETTKNILELFNIQFSKICHGKESNQDHLLDNICDKMITFMQLHENLWKKASPETDLLVYELVIEHNMLRNCVAIVNNGLDHFSKDDSFGKLISRTLMVLTSVIITCLVSITDNLWSRIIKSQLDICDICQANRLTNNYDLISELFYLIVELQNNPVFPVYTEVSKRNSQIISRSSKITKQAWLDMLFVQSRQFLSTLKQIHSVILKDYYLVNILQNFRAQKSRFCSCHPSDKMQCDLINKSVACITAIITQPFLNIEKLPSSAALRMIQNSKEWGGDIRLEGARQIKNIWHDLGNLKNRFSKTFFNVFAKLTTIQNFKIRILAVECLFDIVHQDPENKKTDLITQIDQAMENADSNSSYCEEMTKAFKQVLSSDIQYAEDFQLVEHIIIQMNNIEECSHHLNDNSPINGMIVISNLRDFYKNMGRSDIIGRYLFKLMKIHAKIKNYSEMGNTLLELSSFYKWNNDVVQDVFLPSEYADCEFQWQFKAKLLEESLKYFEKEDWEQGVEVCKELELGYSMFLEDFIKLSDVLGKLSELLKKIMYNDRPESYMYIVFYLGKGFPKFITDLPKKCIVIRTKRNVNEMSIDLNSQFQYTTVERKFPDEIDFNCQDKKIFYMPIKPNKINIPKKYEGKRVKQRILKYYENYCIREFVYKRLLNSTEEDPKKRKIDGCVIICDDQLPNILSIAPVKSLEKITVDPFLEALSDLENQIRKDEMLYQDYEVANIEKRQTMYQKMKDVIIRYVSPVAGGLTKLVQMVPNNDEYLSNVTELVSNALHLINQYLQAFEIYDNKEHFSILLSEFSKLCETVGTLLDIGTEEFNVNILMDQFVKLRGEARVITTIRRPSTAVKIRHEDENTLTISRRNKHAFDILPEIVSERWSNNPLEIPVTHTESKESLSSRTNLIVNDSQNCIQTGPPLPPKPTRIKAESMLRTEQPPPKPRCDSNLNLSS